MKQWTGGPVITSNCITCRPSRRHILFKRLDLAVVGIDKCTSRPSRGVRHTGRRLVWERCGDAWMRKLIGRKNSCAEVERSSSSSSSLSLPPPSAAADRTMTPTPIAGHESLRLRCCCCCCCCCCYSTVMFSWSEITLLTANYSVRTDPAGKVWKVLEFNVEIFKALKSLENDQRYGKVWKNPWKL